MSEQPQEETQAAPEPQPAPAPPVPEEAGGDHEDAAAPADTGGEA